MDIEGKKKSDIATSILAKFQQFSKEKEEAANNKLLQSKEHYLETTKRKKSEDEVMHKGVTEIDVGITKYVSNHCGFKGIVKHRFTDFQVHELTQDGSLVELTSTATPDIPDEDNQFEVDKSIISEEIWTNLEGMIDSEDKDAVTEIDVTNKSKDDRTLIHKTLKRVFGTKIFSNTVTKDDATFIRVGKSSKKDRVCWPKNLPQFLHFTLFKMNLDTTHCVCLLSKKLRVKANYFTYAGTKDRRAITTQRMCVKRKKAEDIASIVIRGAKIGNYEYKEKPLRLGDLSGNKFTITIRNLEVENKIIETAMENLRKRGFVNYFGLQRFGSSAVVPTFAVGKAILMRNWKLAVELILKPRADEKSPPWIKQAREMWWETRDAGKSLRFMSRNQNSLEYRVLKALKQNPSDYQGALLNIPRNTLMLYLHSYQSLVWNKIVSLRLDKFNLEPQIGDLIVVSGKEGSSDEASEVAEKDEADSGEEDNSEFPVQVDDLRRRLDVQTLTEENISNVSIHDIVYPLPGHDVEYPKNEIGTWYKEILLKDGISEEDLKSSNKVFSLTGAYRKAFEKVSDLEWQLIKHSNFDKDLVLSDLDKLENKIIETEAESTGTIMHKSLVMDLTLPPSTYATMVLREIMKIDTSVRFHALLTKDVQETAVKKQKVSNENLDLCNGET